MKRNARLAVLALLVSSVVLPGRLRAGVGTWTGNGPEGGTIRALAIDPTNPATLYAGTSLGGVFKSTNGGSSWRAVNTGLTGVGATQPGTWVTTLVIDPSTPTTLYVGRSGPVPSIDAGVFKSTNGGESWNPINTGLAYTDVVALAIDPSASPATLFAGTSNGGVYRNDGGSSWSFMSLNPDWDFGPDVTALAIGSSVLYAGTSDGVFRYNGGGWAAVSSGLTNTSVNALAVDCGGCGLWDYSIERKSVEGVVLYASTSGGVFKSSDGGQSWTASSSGLANTSVHVLAIDHSTSGTVYAGTEGGIFKSTDGGNTWTAVNTGLTSANVMALAIDPSTPTTLYAGTEGGGVFKSTDGGGSWAATNAGLIGTSVQALAGKPSAPATLYAGTQDSGVFKSSDAGESWAAINAGLTNAHVSAVVVDSSTPATLYVGTKGSGVFKSSDGGGSWASVNAGLFDTQVQALAIDSSNPGTLYAGGYGGVFKSTNGGESWMATTFLSLNVVALAVDSSTPGTLYAGGYGGARSSLYKSTNGGESWSAMNAGLRGTQIFQATVQTLAIDPSTPATLYAGTDSSGVFKSTNGGGNWTAASTGLTNRSVLALMVDPSTPTTLYAGTSGGGVFQSTNAGSTWTAINAGLGNPIVNVLAIDPSTPTRLYAGTNGGGVNEVHDYLATCVFDSTTLCLSGGRFKVTTQWTTAAGQSGSGQAVALAGGDTGYFTFFDPLNVEVAVKVLNGCSTSGSFWILAGGLTDVGVVMTVTDSLTGTVKIYTNPQGTPFRPIEDTETFATCAAGSTAGVQPYAVANGASLLQPGVIESFHAGAIEPCVADARTLCVSNSRYQVRAQWLTPDGRSGAGQVINLTADTGAFWFFSPSNIEVVVKVLNGCGVNTRYWTFAGGLTDVNVILTVTDTQTGTVRTYINPQGAPFGPIQDTSAFATCP